ncbi:MAG: hypothetical protein A2293_02125 [Elusimicrobia bacterium RIFOXYB2_FULL_49_7]|nr:MAG: hypothetical protein A2293_02125 [Elusimicrobia bacterium RIFOXYB2_FULL_49_7]
MNRPPVKFGVISYGHFFKTNFIVAFRQCPEVDIIGVYNRGEERRLQAEQDGFFATSDLDELLAMPGLEAVAIGSSNNAHKEHALAAIRAGKHVFCEKPLALSLSDAEEMADAAEKSGLITHVNHPAPYSEQFQIIKKILADNLGRPFHCWLRYSRAFGLWNQGARHTAVAHPKESGGWTFHHHCHGLDAVCVLLGTNDVERVFHMELKSCPEAPSEEIINSFIQFRNGTTAILSDTTSIGSFLDLGIQAEKGDLRVLDGQATLVTTGPFDPSGRPGNLSSRITSMPVPEQEKEIPVVAKAFADAVRGGKNDLLSFRFICNQYRILDAMKKSAAIGDVVRL